MSPTLSLPCCCDCAGPAASNAPAANAAAIAPTRRRFHGFISCFLLRWMSYRSPGAQLEALDFTRCRLGQLVDELDPARVLVGRELAFDVRPELLGQRVGALLPALQHDESDGLH